MNSLLITIVFILAVLFGSFYLIYLFVTKYYVRIPPNKAGIIFGRKFEIKDDKTGHVRERGYRIVKGGASLIIPILEEIEYIDLSNRKIDLQVEDIRSKNGVKVDVEAVAIIRIASDEASLEIAAEQFGDMKRDDVNAKIQDILDKTLEGHFRTIISMMTPEELYQKRDVFSQEVQKSADQPLQAMGMKVVDFTIKRVSDKDDYLNSIGVQPAEEEKKKAAIARSLAEKEIKEQQAIDKTAIREAVEGQNIKEEQSRGREEIEQIQVLERSKVAKIESDIARIRSEIERMHKMIELQEKEDELELIKVRLEQKKKVYSASGDEQASKRKALEIKNIAQADAEAIRMRAEAEAEGRRMLAEAYKQLDPTAKMLLIVEKLPEVLKSLLGEEGLAKVFAEIAKPIGAIDSVKIYDFGGGNGQNGGGPVDKWANTAPQLLMGIVSKLNDMGMGDFLDKIGLTSDVVKDMQHSAKDKEEAPSKKEATTEQKKIEPKSESIKIQQIEEKKQEDEEEEADYEEIKTGDTIELDVSRKNK